ncbi:flagellar basal body rod protein FlgB [Emcibacteraceae bacterium Y4]|nr:flagellar basal body rod protein FlgB [Pseudemcibacter aquimaris]
MANANTPGYIAQDLEEVSFEQHLNRTNETESGQRKTVMKTSDPRHLNASGASSSGFEIRQTTSDYMISTPDGNTVDLERELSKMAEVQMEYTLASNLYKKHIGMIKMSLGRRQ